MTLVENMFQVEENEEKNGLKFHDNGKRLVFRAFSNIFFATTCPLFTHECQLTYQRE